MSASAELARKLEKRNKINEGEVSPTMNQQGVSINSENPNLAPSASDELALKLEKRNKINEGEVSPTMNHQGVSVYSENPNLTRKTIEHLETKFKEVAEKTPDRTSLKLPELKTVFENLGCPQTHVTLTGLLRDAKQDPKTGALTFREFLAVFRKACSDEIDEDSPLKQLASLNDIDVGEKGVTGAKEFFQAKMKASADNSFAKEVEQEKARKLQEEEESKTKQEAFKDMRSKFCAA